MTSADKWVEQLQSANSNKRYEACEELRVIASLPPAAFDALKNAARDGDRQVAEAAIDALAAHAAPDEAPGATPPPGQATRAAPPRWFLGIGISLAVYWLAMFAVGNGVGSGVSGPPDGDVLAILPIACLVTSPLPLLCGWAATAIAKRLSPAMWLSAAAGIVGGIVALLILWLMLSGLG